MRKLFLSIIALTLGTEHPGPAVKVTKGEPAFLEHLNREKPRTMDDFAALYYRWNYDPNRDFDSNRAEHEWRYFADHG